MSELGKILNKMNFKNVDRPIMIHPLYRGG